MQEGQKVVCVTEFVGLPKQWTVVGEPPQVGQVYVIRKSTPMQERFQLQLIGVEVYLGLDEGGWDSVGFRLLDDMRRAAR